MVVVALDLGRVPNGALLGGDAPDGLVLEMILEREKTCFWGLEEVG